MKRLSIITLLALMPVWLLAAKVDFKSIPLKDAVKLAQAQKKNIFIDFYATWCGPCKWMEKNAFADPAVVKYMDANYISLKIDVESELGTSKQYTDFDISAMPTMVFLTQDGEMAFKKVGAMDAEGFLQLATRMNDKSQQLTPLYKQYKADKTAMTDQEISNLLQAMAESEHEDYNTVWNSWRKGLEQTQWLEPAVFQQLYVSALPFNSPEVKHLKANAETANANIPQGVLEAGVMKMVQKKYNDAAMAQDKDAVQEVVAFTRAAMPNDAGKMLALKFELTYFMMVKDFDGLAKAANQEIPGMEGVDMGFLNQIAWTVFENVDDKALLNKTAKWFHEKGFQGKSITSLTADGVVESDQAEAHYMMLDTLAALRLKAGNAEGVKTAEAVIGFAQAHDVDADGTIQLLENYGK